VSQCRRRTAPPAAQRGGWERETGDGHVIIISKFKIQFWNLNLSPLSWPQIKNY